MLHSKSVSGRSRSERRRMTSVFGMTAETDTTGLKVASQFLEVVDLAVEDENSPTVLRRHRLMAERRKVLDRKPSVGKRETLRWQQRRA